jgi:uncharacterized membrane protein (DUF4010 family)
MFGAAIICGGLGWAAYRSVFRKLLTNRLMLVRLEENSLLLFFGISVIAQNLITLVFTADRQGYQYLNEIIEIGTKVEVKNPYELSNAMKFGVFYAFILFISRNTLKYLGDYGLYIVAAVSGLSDVDAITLSVSKLFTASEVSLLTGIVTVIVAATVNTFLKWFLTISMGSRELFKLVTPGFIALIGGEVLGVSILIAILH